MSEIVASLVVQNTQRNATARTVKAARTTL